MRYEPFIINKNQGIEIELLKNMAEHLNTTFDMQITMKSEDWGDKVNGAWQDNFGKIFNTLKIGIGNVAIEADRIEDFDFTFSHYTTTLIWVVPIANYMKKWRVLTIIFSLDLWAISFAVVFALAILFILAARITGDIPYFKTVAGGFQSSFQIIVNTSIHKTPKTNLVRFVFVIGLIYSLIITCIYTSGLMHLLRYSIREHQIDSIEEILESGLEIGGLKEYRERFVNPKTGECADELCKRYKYFSRENDTAQIWLSLVEQRQACTPLPRLFVKYYMVKSYDKGKNDPTDENKIKLFIINNPINVYPVAIVMRKGNPFRKIFDIYHIRYFEAGLLLPILNHAYRQEFSKLMYLVEHSHDGPEQMDFYHLQGPFGILGIGYLIAILTFIVEITFGKKHDETMMKRTKQNTGPREYRRINHNNKKLHNK
ncbi:hypothetical protein HHI36_015040 [Cryptolaemus montrouzieri]|uniref:Uncharacterized protein n=1 Tax=Cryptolaemus montrouzieri TaxID=559131 RepID=A0ABD2N4S0_9CUCU